MIFNNCEDIEIDIKTKISKYMSQTNNDIKGLVSIILSYLYEMKNIKEIETYSLYEINKNEFSITFSKDKQSHNFYTSLSSELRKIKIKKIYQRKVL